MEPDDHRPADRPGRPHRQVSREVICAEALGWMAARGPIAGCAVVTSLPDASELEAAARPGWPAWFAGAAQAALSLCAPDGVAIFYQTDVLRDGEWIDKGHLVASAAEAVGARMLWHRIVCRAAPGSASSGRPGYAHLVAFGHSRRRPAAGPRTDVLADGGPPTWSRGIGPAAAAEACRYLRACTGARLVIDPFCGEGMVLAVANALGLDAIGVEIDRRRAGRARTLVVAL